MANISFLAADGRVVGTLYIEDPMRFEGNVDESVRLFFEAVIKERWFGGLDFSS